MAQTQAPLEETFKDIHFPLAGLDVSQAFWRQPNRPVEQLPLKQGQHFPTQIYARTCAQAVNVRGFDAANRLRGGSRPGLTQYLPVTPNGITFITQELTYIVYDNKAAIP